MLTRLATKIAAGLILGFVGGSLALFGLAWGGYAIFMALIDWAGPAGAAGITAGIFLFVPLIVLMVAALVRPKPKPEGSAAIMSALASIARDKPVLAMVAAGLFGMADVLMNRWRRRRDD